MSNKKKIIVADGVSSNQFSLGTPIESSTLLTSSEDVLSINKGLSVDGTVVLSDGNLPNEAISKGQLDQSIQSVVDIIKSGLSPFVDIIVSSSEFTMQSDGAYEYTVLQSVYGYEKASVGSFGSIDSNGDTYEVEYDSTILSSGDIKISIGVQPQGSYLIRLILGGLDPNYVDFANQFNSVNQKLGYLQSQIDDLKEGGGGGGDLPSSEPSYSTLIQDTDWGGSSGVYKYTIPYSSHNLSKPYIASLQRLNTNGEFDGEIVYSYKVYTDGRVVITVDYPISCEIYIRSKT